MKRVFLSHHKDTPPELLGVLRHFLQDGGFAVRDDASALVPGQEIASSITSEIREADAVVAILDASGPLSSHVMLELGIATGLGKPLLVIGDPAKIPSLLESVRLVRQAEDPRSTALATLQTVRALTSSPPPASSEYSSEKLDSMSWQAFEELVAKHLQTLGLATARPEAGEPYDFLATARGSNKRWAIEVKKLQRQNLVPVMAVRQLVDIVDAVRADGGVLVSSSGFTPSAEALAAEAGVPLALVSVDRLLSVHSQSEFAELFRR